MAKFCLESSSSGAIYTRNQNIMKTLPNYSTGTNDYGTYSRVYQGSSSVWIYWGGGYIDISTASSSYCRLNAGSEPSIRCV